VLHDARANLLRFGHLARSMRRADTRAGLWSEAGRGGALEGRLSIVVDEGSRRRRGFGADPILLAVGRAPTPGGKMDA
jgi:hypothetical protein